MNAAEVLQLCLIGQRTGTIKCGEGDGIGSIFVRDGLVIHAVAGAVVGEDAFYKLLLDPTVESDLVSEETSKEQTIKEHTEYLLMEAARRSDESLGRQSSLQQLTYLQLISESTPRYFPMEGRRMFLGRNPQNSISLQNPSVSSRHCELNLIEGVWHLADCNARNGTFLNGHAVGQNTPLQPGDLIQLGAVLLRCETGDMPENPPQAAVPVSSPAADPKKETSKLTLPEKRSAQDKSFTFRTYKPVTEAGTDNKHISIGVVIVLLIVAVCVMIFVF